VTRVCTKTLDVQVRIEGQSHGQPIFLLHGWPDDASTWDRIAPKLNKAGFRTIAPMHRGFASTRFLSANTPRTGNVGILAYDVVDLADALGIETFFVAGHDWGSNIAESLAVGWPRRVPRIAMLSTPSRLSGLQTPPFDIARRYWYHWFQATRRGAEAVAADPKGFARIMWDTWSPPGWFDNRTFNKVARSFRNPDWIEVTLHSYRSRWGEAPYDPRSAKLEAKLKATKSIGTPTVFFHGGSDGVTPPSMTATMRSKFTGKFQRILLDGIGHFPTREVPDVVSKGLIKHFSSKS
jgi:pimeloyl-ACP methyl ester carboxylesterase